MTMPLKEPRQLKVIIRTYLNMMGPRSELYIIGVKVIDQPPYGSSEEIF